jgi:uncharacterized membrane protein YedE/YeeE
MRTAAALLIGLIFGLGIAISGMGNPAKVINFFDVAGAWDPSLALVMAAALAVTIPGYALVFRCEKPVIDDKFNLPKSTVIDARLIGGSALFGVGWGMAGFCPGGALPMIGTGQAPVYLFLASMAGGMVLARAVIARTSA